MRNYKDYQKTFIGTSDMASLTCRSVMEVFALNFGEDGTYQAYIVDENAEIGKHYNIVKECKHWLKIYDDNRLSFKCQGKEIKIYRAKEMGCIIQIIK